MESFPYAWHVSTYCEFGFPKACRNSKCEVFVQIEASRFQWSIFSFDHIERFIAANVLWASTIFNETRIITFFSWVASAFQYDLVQPRPWVQRFSNLNSLASDSPLGPGFILFRTSRKLRINFQIYFSKRKSIVTHEKCIHIILLWGNFGVAL